MSENYYKQVCKFNCCGKSMVTVIMNGAACVMDEMEYNRMVENERKFRRRNRLKRIA